MKVVILLTVLLLIILIYIFVRISNSPTGKGKIGEIFVHNILSQLPEGYFVMDDILLKAGNKTTQIDHVVISQYGIFTIETKNYRGEIYGDDNREEWTQMIVTDVHFKRKWYKTYTYVKKNHFYNPVKQSIAHVYAIKNILKEWPNLTIIPIIVFVGGASLAGIQSKYHVIYGHNLISTIMSYKYTCISADDVINIKNRVEQKNARQLINNQTHINNIEASKREKFYKIKSGICPQCGGTLVLKNGKYGQFYGCNNYPKCSFTTH